MEKRKPVRKAQLAMAASLLLGLGACEQLSQEAQLATFVDPGLLKSALTVSGNEGAYSSVRIEIVGVNLRRASPAEGETPWVELPMDPYEVDLAAMDGTYEVLSRVMLPEGAFTEIRLITADSGTVTRSDGTEGTLTVPSGAQTGIKIKCQETIEVTSAMYTVAILDIDLDHSLVEQGNGDFNFKPVLRCAGTIPIVLPPAETSGESSGETGGETGGESGGESGGELPEEGSTFIEPCETAGTCFTPILGV